MHHYTQLTREERYQICSLLKAGHSPSEIARLIKRHKSTISRELRRNRGQQGLPPAAGALPGRCTAAGLRRQCSAL